MSFKITNLKPSGKMVKWRFEGYENVFTSEVERFKRNVEFWKNKLMVANDVQVELLEGAQWLQNYLEAEKQIIDVEHEIVEDDATITDSTPELASGDEPDAQPNVEQTTEDTVDTPKRKPRSKTV